ncbi:hypothetical protein J5N97_023246 [Dioscorea zingiberensis]|uniref:Glycosyltransferase n=1 Tax=Dioscorea zingiberensis TaxID=325984 RepID=A0A9D5HBD6_9LILI|nr:hypothetical protein J5N97_023246 [Dioscorea zingiberensis]
MGGHEQHHVVLFPVMAQGHINPFIALADLLHRRRPDLKITIVNTPLNIQSIKSSLPPNSTIRLRSLPFSPSDHGLPPGTESTAGLPFSLFINLLEASESLHPHFEQLLHDIAMEDGHLPSCIIADNFLAWTVETARKLGISHSVFITGGAFGHGLLLSIGLHFLRLPTTQTNHVSVPDFPEIQIDWSQLPRHLFVPDNADKWTGFFHRQNSYCFQSNSMLVNTVKEFETTGLSMLHKLFGLPVFPVGPVLCKPLSSSLDDVSRCVEWLDSHRPGTVLYVSFGSQNSINASQMMELAVGLEESGKPFIWVIRPPFGLDVGAEFNPEWLPEGYEERMREKKQGLLLVHVWAPQLDILGHGSTAAFLSHCGWNSVLESLSHGVPIIGWPLGGEQMYNSKFLEEEVGVCLELARGNREDMMSAKVEREGVKKVVEMVMGGTEKGVEMKKKAMEISELIRASMEVNNGVMGSSIQSLEEFFTAFNLS